MNQLPLTLYRAAQVRELDRITIEDYGIPGFELMSKAGEAVFQAIGQKWPKAHSLAVFCGGGNNGGDGFIVARLARASGWDVSVYSLSNPEQLKGDALTAFQSFRQSGGAILPYKTGQSIKADVIVDALLGTGLDRPVTGLYADAIREINHSNIPVIAVDIPSGLNADTGNAMGCAVKAGMTVTFIGLKQGLFTGYAADYCGKIIYDSLEVPDLIFRNVSSKVARVLPTPFERRNPSAHKGLFGRVLIVGGDHGFTGAVRMAGEAALRIGAGLVTIATRAAHAPVMNIGRPELMCHGVETADALLPLLKKADAVVLGPGLSQSEWAKRMFNAVITSDKPLVVDADGLNLLAVQPGGIADAIRILTPHPGEAARLLGCSSAEIQQDRFAAAAAIRFKYGGIAVLKGAGTLIASEQRIAVSGTGNPGMASGGMGDVLSGVIAGLLAQGLPPPQAAEQGVYLHGLAADIAAAKGGERGLLATDLMPYIRELVN
ncbi:MAG: NAD(P)H-hydrate dehydratase [Gammaproteobacteria bacterium]